MIHEIDEAVRSLLLREALTGTDVEVAFDAPTREWSSRRNAPTVDAYLYDIREDLRRREVGRVDRRGSDGRVAERVEPPRWYKLSYLITAWTERPEDEHRLLAAMLRGFLLHDHLPADVLTGSLVDLGRVIPYTCGLPPPEDRALSDVWSALGGELKPSLDVVVIAPFDLSREIEVGPPVLEGPRLVVGTAEPGKSSRRSRSRRPATSSEAAPPSRVPAASVGNAGPAAPLAEEERVGGRVGDVGRRLRLRELPR